MSSPFLDRAPTIGALLVLVLAIAAVLVAGHNRGLQETVAAGQAKMAGAQTAANLDNSLIRMLTSAAVEHDDTAIRELLAANGITYRQTGATKPPGTAGAAGKGGK